jgi:hypothetical protein
LEELFEYWQVPPKGLVATFKNVSGASANDVRHDHIIRFPITTGDPYFPVNVEWNVRYAEIRYDALQCAGTTASVTPTDSAGGGSVSRVEDVRSIVSGPQLWPSILSTTTTSGTFQFRSNDQTTSITWKVTTTSTFDISSGTTITANPKTRIWINLLNRLS